MPTISPPTVRTMRDVLLGHGYPVWEGPYNLNLFGLRAIPRDHRRLGRPDRRAVPGHGRALGLRVLGGDHGPGAALGS
jgi:hypothetical protein